MSEHTDQTADAAGAVPPPIELEDFIEAVTRGVARALAAQDEVSGYAMRPVSGRISGGAGGGKIGFPGTITMGLIYTPPSGPAGGGHMLSGIPAARQQ